MGRDLRKHLSGREAIAACPGVFGRIRDCEVDLRMIEKAPASSRRHLSHAATAIILILSCKLSIPIAGYKAEQMEKPGDAANFYRTEEDAAPRDNLVRQPISAGPASFLPVLIRA